VFHVFRAIEAADTANLFRLSGDFKDEVNAVLSWRNGDLADRYYDACKVAA
jgi:hypothetical protein